MIGLSEMHGYGYTWEEMLPLTKETALELFDSDLAVYQLHKDGSETLIEDKEQIMGMKASSVLKRAIGRMRGNCAPCRQSLRKAAQTGKHSFYMVIPVNTVFTS